MEQKQKKSINIGFRGWMLVIYQFMAFLAFTAFTNWPMNVLADLYGGASKVSTIYTVFIVLGIIVQLILSSFIGKLKSVKNMGIGLGILTMAFGMAIMLIPPTQTGIWQICYGIVCFTSSMWSMFSVGILVGQWFPRRKGTIMGITTLAFPIANGLIGAFAGMVFKKGAPDVFGAFIPFWIVCLIGLVIGIIFIKDYPEQCGCYRDNDKSMTPEMAKQIMDAEIEAKKTSVWKLNHTLTNRDFWFITLPMAAILMCAIGVMTQTASILATFDIEKFGGYAGVMAMVMIFGLIGSYALGLLDTKLGTKKAIIIAVVLMILSGIIGMIPSGASMVVSMMLLALFMGASSNFVVSAAAQYWRREDFSTVFASMNPIANILQAVGPMIVAILFMIMGYQAVFGFILISGIISLILILLFSSKHVKEKDDKYRAAAGKELDDALVGRK